jgi:hypothetical protein
MNVCVVWIAVRYYRCLENGARVDGFFFFLNNPSTALRARLNFKKNTYIMHVAI